MRSDFLDLLNYCKRVGMGVMLATNGWFVTKQIAVKVREAGVSLVRVSIDGASPEVHDSIRGIRGSFERAKLALKYLREAGIPKVGMSPTVSRQNIHQIQELVQLALNEGADEIRFNPVCATGRAANLNLELSEQDSLLLQKTLQKLQIIHKGKIIVDAPEGIDLDKIKRKRCYSNSGLPDIMGCGVGRTSLAISPDGQLLHCILYRKVIGDLKKTSFYDIWRNSPYLIQQRSYGKDCEGCIHRPLCSGRCPLVKDMKDKTRREILQKTNGCSISLERSVENVG